MKDPKEFVRKLRLCYPIEPAVALIEARDREAKLEILRELYADLSMGGYWATKLAAKVASLEAAGTGESGGTGS